MCQRVIAKAFVTVVTLLVLTAPVTRAQDNCQAFQAIMPMTLDINIGWSGPVYAVMGTEVLIGKWFTGVPAQTTCDAVSCQDTGSRSSIDFGGSGLMNPGNTLTIELQTAQYPVTDVYGTYRAVWKIVGGTGRFAQASGTAFEVGPFVVWDVDKAAPQGRYTGEVDGGICGAKPNKTAPSLSSAKPVTSTPATVLPFYLRQLSPSRRN